MAKRTRPNITPSAKPRRTTRGRRVAGAPQKQESIVPDAPSQPVEAPSQTPQVVPGPWEDSGGSGGGVTEALCRQVREHRHRLGWTLEKMSTACGVSRSMLSQIERGQTNPTLAVAYRIAQALGFSLGDLVDGPHRSSTIDVIRSDDGTYHFRSDGDCRIRTLSPLHLEKDVEFYEVTLRPGGVLRSAPHFAGTREFLTVESGHVKVTSSRDEVTLSRGDSAHYPADVPHAIENTSNRQDAIAFLVVTYGRA